MQLGVVAVFFWVKPVVVSLFFTFQLFNGAAAMNDGHRPFVVTILTVNILLRSIMIMLL